MNSISKEYSPLCTLLLALLMIKILELLSKLILSDSASTVMLFRCQVMCFMCLKLSAVWLHSILNSLSFRGLSNKTISALNGTILRFISKRKLVLKIKTYLHENEIVSEVALRSPYWSRTSSFTWYS